ncbi:hypothetical protein [Comamonas testosteroni]|uniref:hypothetical protein n=1 Tax=Comamonas testosteroni TaxID=285 RepID=UPI0005B41A20|nr:hypothetical protein [Comamonas testosteroni]
MTISLSDVAGTTKSAHQLAVTSGQMKLLEVLQIHPLEAVYARSGWRLLRMPAGVKRADFDALLKSGKARITGPGMLEAVRQQHPDIQPGQAVVFADEIYFVEKNYGSSGRVSDLHGREVVEPFYWTFEGETCRIATKTELLALPTTTLTKAALALLN